ncbi:hypothetical protein GGI07_005591 [Coemansia sp. Benny D115]|nr:hypothetical protein GGI07_005591 [Coemansia sp. Benny D115]
MSQKQQEQQLPQNTNTEKQAETISPTTTPPQPQGTPSLSQILASQHTSDRHQGVQAYIAAHQQHTDAIDEPHTVNEWEREMAELEKDLDEKLKTVAKKQPKGGVLAKIDWRRTLRFVGLYLALPFVTGVMAGMGEIFANEAMYRWGWRGARPIHVPGRHKRVFPVKETVD